MSTFERLTEPNKLFPGLKAMFAERGRLKQTISNVQSVVKEGSLRALSWVPGSAYSAWALPLKLLCKKQTWFYKGLSLSAFLQNNEIKALFFSLTYENWRRWCLEWEMKIFNIISSNFSIHGDISSTAKLFFVICCEGEAQETPMLFVYVPKPLGASCKNIKQAT